MKIVQCDENADGSKETDEPPAVDDDLTLDIQDQKMIEKGDGQDTDGKARGYQRTVCMADDGDDEGYEDEQRQRLKNWKSERTLRKRTN